VYSRSDGIVDWRACIDESADEVVEIDASHCGMAVSRPAYAAVARALAGFAAELRALEQRDALDVRRLREHVDRADADEAVAGLDHLRRVRRQRGRIAGDVDHP